MSLQPHSHLGLGSFLKDKNPSVPKRINATKGRTSSVSGLGTKNYKQAEDPVFVSHTVHGLVPQATHSENCALLKVSMHPKYPDF